ncbi:unnamed protein product [Didymodactylos carnosus]|uniref:Sodium-dependent phosphate transport protein 2B n=1 Tax=Didymodactylos carnosus TaxID=1234261 RepID=A0A8S2DJ10_9BILA|nr:unnamed protein product [Didymodactylos carnosus]CAF3707022.1 unnamed protein product [Didymodactylos carnosus]
MLEHFSLRLLILFFSFSKTELIFRITGSITKSIKFRTNSSTNQQFLNVITKPATDKIVQVNLKAVATATLDNEAIEDIALGKPVTSLLKRYCDTTVNGATTLNIPLKQCSFLLAKLKWPDWGIGLLLVIVTIVSLCACLIILVKLLQSMLKGAISNILRKTIGCIITILVQSSSIFTSTLTPLVGIGVTTIERVYPFTLGSNIGTTITGIMAALTAKSVLELRNPLQIALCHTAFNITGKRILTFFVIPLIVFGLSMAGWYVFGAVMIPIALVVIFVIIMNILMSKIPQRLPPKLRNWSWLPRPLRSIKFYDEHLCDKLDWKKVVPRPISHFSKQLNNMASNIGEDLRLLINYIINLQSKQHPFKATTFNAWLDKYIKNRDPLEKFTGIELEFDNLSSIIKKSIELMQNATIQKTLLSGAIMVSAFLDFTTSTNPVIDLNATLLLQQQPSSDTATIISTTIINNTSLASEPTVTHTATVFTASLPSHYIHIRFNIFNIATTTTCASISTLFAPIYQTLSQSQDNTNHQQLPPRPLSIY